ncbi:MAG: DNA-binding response regulator [Deltaproteobacteria bacterium CG11_big_fil_rev_8_21_14_0_20_47_16]|nr:MAG: DNA-binding response regulator [Deltaproteobacteria bacterium CG11_big_fil_rev_8_21_14_0_20_47_16]
MNGNILIVDDEAMIRRALEKFLGDLGYKTWTAENGKTAMEVIRSESINLVITDLMMPEMNGVELISQVKQASPNTVCIIMTAFGTITSAVEGMKAGAYHYLTKPFELDDIASLVATALEHQALKVENATLRRQLRSKYKFEGILGTSAEMNSVFSLMEKVADTDSTILILGESGTGKELVAKAIHYNSRRSEKPLVIVNCAAIPENLLESELFGHVKGSFTGAYQAHEGHFAQANGGTIFLDEIGEMSPKLQVKLLRVLQERKYEPVGSTRTENVDVRIITATNRDLEQEVKEGRFREDLFYRLNVIPVKIPALRNRHDDIPLLLNHFLKKSNETNERNVEGFTPEALKVLCEYDWPGNVRELENLVERTVVIKEIGWMDVSDLPEKISKTPAHFHPQKVVIPDSGLSFNEIVNDFENELILQALRKCNWNKNKAATLLQLNRTTLVEKIKKKQLDKTLPA